MKIGKSIDAEGSPQSSDYAQAMEINGATSMLFVSGQIGMASDGVVPDDFEQQSRLAWKNVEAQLAAADMAVENIVKINTFLSDRKYSEVNGRVRTEALRGNRPANSTMVATILDSDWLLEVEVIAAK